MSRLFRWQTIVPRLLLVVIGLLTLQYALGFVARSIVVRSSESAIGVPIEAAHARVSLANRQIVLGDLRLGNRNKQAHDPIDIGRCTLDFAALPLFYKQLIVERGTVTNVRFGKAGRPVKPSGLHAASSTKSSSDEGGELAAQWLERVAKIFEKDLLAQFESVQRTDELCTRWPQQSAALYQRVEALKARATDLQEKVRVAQANPLRHVEFLRGLPDSVAALQTDFAQVASETEQLLDSLEADRRAIVACRQRDAEFVRKSLLIEPVDSSALTAYLVREQVAMPLDELIEWLRWTRDVVPAGAAARRAPSRGENVLFAGRRPSPSLLIRELRLHGTGRVGGQPVELRGSLTDFTNSPSRHPKPMRLRLKGSGSRPFELQATVDRTGPAARDELLVDCQGIVLPKMDLGRPNQFSLSLGPSVGSLSISATVHGDKLTGDIQLVQKQVQIAPALHGALSDVLLAASLNDTLGNVEGLATRVSLGGTLAEPKWSLWSNLGPAVAEGMDRMLQKAADRHGAVLLARAQRQVDERLAGLERQAAEQHAQLTAQRNQATSDLARIAGQQAPAKRLTREQLGRRLPANSLFR